MTLEDKTEWDEYVSASEVLPPGEFHGGISFFIGKRENHGNGYHAHILVLKNGKFVRSGYLLTYEDGTFYVTEHGNKGNTLFDFTKLKTGLLREISNDLPRVFKNIPNNQMLKTFKDAQPLCSLEVLK